MGCLRNLKCRRRLNHFAILYLILLISASSSQLKFSSSEGRIIPEMADNSKTVNEEKAILRAQIGSRPPRCNRRCSSCTHCEAIQVPTNPQIKNGIKNSTTVSAIEYARSDYNSNYKPMSWKCKCGNLIFNP